MIMNVLPETDKCPLQKNFMLCHRGFYSIVSKVNALAS